MSFLSSGAAGAVVALAVGVAGTARAAQPDPPIIATWHRQAVEGHAQARYDLAIALLCGKRVPRDRAQAALWLALASEQQHTGAQSVFGWQLMTGTGVRRDDAHAAHWLQKAAEASDTAAQNNLGVLYALGRGVPQDRRLGERWFRAAAEQGATDAARNLARLLGEEAGATSRGPAPPSAHPALVAAGCGALPRTATTSRREP